MLLTKKEQLVRAAEERRKETVKMLQDAGANVDVQSSVPYPLSTSQGQCLFFLTHTFNAHK